MLSSVHFLPSPERYKGVHVRLQCYQSTISRIYLSTCSGVEVYQRRLRYFNRAKAVEKVGREIARNWMVVGTEFECELVGALFVIRLEMEFLGRRSIQPYLGYFTGVFKKHIECR